MATYQSSGGGCVTLRSVGVPKGSDDETAKDDDGLSYADIHASAQPVGGQAPDDQGEQVDAAVSCELVHRERSDHDSREDKTAKEGVGETGKREKVARVGTDNGETGELLADGEDHDGQGSSLQGQYWTISKSANASIYEVNALEDVSEPRLEVEQLVLVFDRSCNNAVLFLDIVAFDVAKELLERFERFLLLSSSGVEPRRLGDECPEEDHDTDGGEQDAHSKEVVVGSLLVELLHHDRDHHVSDVRPEQQVNTRIPIGDAL